MTRHGCFIDGVLSRRVCRALEAPDLADHMPAANVLVRDLVLSTSFSSLTQRHQTRLLKAILTAQVRGATFPTLDSALHLHGWDRMNVILQRLATSPDAWATNVGMLDILVRFVLRCRGPTHTSLAGDLVLTAGSIFPRDRGVPQEVLQDYVRVVATMYASMVPAGAPAFAALHRMVVHLREEVWDASWRMRGLDGECEDILVCADDEADVLLVIDRADMLTSSSRAVLRCTDQQWERCQTIDIRFLGESGSGEGVARDWISELCTELFFRSGLFSGCHADPAVVHPDPRSPDSEAIRATMDLVGRVMALALRLEIPTGAHLSNAAVALITGRVPDLQRDLEQLDPVLARTCSAIRLMDPGQDAELGTFLMLGSDHELFPGGAQVSVSGVERAVFADMLSEGQIYGRCAEACLWIRQGMRRVLCQETCTDIDEMSTKDFNASFGGQGVSRAVDVEDWQRHTDVSVRSAHRHGHDQGHDQGQADILFQIIRAMTSSDRRRFLRFWTGSASLPHGGFRGLSGRLQLVLTPETPPSSHRLPTSHTCIRTLVVYGNMGQEAMRSAIQLCLVSMDFDDSTE